MECRKWYIEIGAQHPVKPSLAACDGWLVKFEEEVSARHPELLLLCPFPHGQGVNMRKRKLTRREQ